MSTDDDKPTATTGEASGQPGAAKPSGLDAKPEAEKVVSPEAAAVAAVQGKINAAATKWLKERFGFAEDSEGTLHLAEQPARGDLPLRAEQFIKGFARTVAEMAPVGPGEARKPEQVPDASEAVGRFLSKMGGAVSDAVQEYLRRNALDPQHPERPVAINGQFIRQHGVPVITKIMQSLGAAFEEPQAGQPAPAPAAATSETGAKGKVQVEIELPKLLKQLVEDFASGSKEAAAPAPASAPPTPAAAPSAPKKDEP